MSLKPTSNALGFGFHASVETVETDPPQAGFHVVGFLYNKKPNPPRGNRFSVETTAETNATTY